MQPYYFYNTVEAYYSCNTVRGSAVVSAMVSFESFAPVQGVPIYLQIVQYIKRNAVSGVITDGEEVPSRRVLSALLGVNPNTVQKAYRILEEEHLMESHAGAKSYMVLPQSAVVKLRQELLESDAASAVKNLKEMGLTKEEALQLIETYWD